MSWANANRWTPAEDAELTRQWNADVALPELNIPGRSAEACRQRAVGSLGLPKRRHKIPESVLTTEQRAEGRRLFLEEGLSSGEIAAHFKVTRNVVIGALRRDGALKVDGRAVRMRPSAPRPRKARPAPAAQPTPVRAKLAPAPPPAAPPPAPEALPAVTIHRLRNGTALTVVDQRATGDGSAAVLQLNPGGCRWPLGDPRIAGFRFCGGRIDPRAYFKPVYCAEHAALAGGGRRTDAEVASSVRSLRRFA